MSKDKWHYDQLKRLLTLQQEEYKRCGLEHELYAEDDSAFYSKWLYHRLIMLSLVPKECRRPGTKVLDVGGGKGRISTLLSDLDLECVNIDCFYLEKDTLNVKGEPLIPLLKSYSKKKGVQIIARDVYTEGIPFPDETFDLVIFSEVIEHLPNSPKPLLSDIYRVMRKNGWMILTTPNLVSFKRRISTLFGFSTRSPLKSFYHMVGYPPGSVYRGHNREYTLAEVKYMLTQEKFTIEDAELTDFNTPQSLAKVCQTFFTDITVDWKANHLRIKGKLLKLGDFVSKKVFNNMKDNIVILSRK
jgi:2-polyprenyl-3-methyl-5-hydroxy-6-metoxy-1,4-benzoquinol methylase